MGRLPKLLIWFVIVFHFAAFVLEAFLWMQPGIYQAVLPRLTNRASPAALEQALVLRALFVNQGFYNLFLALAGLAGMRLSERGKLQAGHALCGYMCLSALGAGIVLALSTRAYVGAFVQAVPAAVALSLSWQRVKEPNCGSTQNARA